MPASAYSTRLQLPLPAGGDFDTRANHNELVTQAELYIADKPTVDAHVTAGAPHSGHAVIAGANTFSASQTASESTATVIAWGARVNGDGSLRWSVAADGKTVWGSGSAGSDVNLYRSAPGILRTDQAMFVGNGLTIGAGSLVVSGDASSFKAVSSTQSSLFVRPSDDLNTSTILVGFTNAAGSAFRWSVDKSGSVNQSNGLIVGSGGLVVQAGGLTVVGNSNITGTLTGLTGLTISTGTVNFTGATLIGFGGSGGNFANPTITGTVSGGATYAGISLSSPTITGTVSGGATYTGISLNNPNITGTVTGGASYSAITLTAPVVTGGINVTGNATFSATLTAPTLNSTTHTSTTLIVTGTTTLGAQLNMGLNAQIANSTGFFIITANGSLYLRGGGGSFVIVDQNALNTGQINASGLGTFNAGLQTVGPIGVTFSAQLVMQQNFAISWTDGNSQVMSFNRTMYFDEYNGSWHWRDTANSSYWAMTLSRLGNLSVGIGSVAPLGTLHVGGYYAGVTAWNQLGNAGANNPNTISNGNGVLMVEDHAGSGAGNGGVVMFASAGGNYFAGIKGFLNDGSNNSTGDLSIAVRRVSTNTSLTESLVFKTNGDIYMAPAAVGMTSGFLWLSSATGAPGTPASVPTFRAAIYYDASTNQICVWNGGWKRTGSMS